MQCYITFDYSIYVPEYCYLPEEYKALFISFA